MASSDSTAHILEEIAIVSCRTVGETLTAWSEPPVEDPHAKRCGSREL